MSLDKRIAALEASSERAEGPCFWCLCEDTEGPCEHRHFERVRHEVALAELE